MFRTTHTSHCPSRTTLLVATGGALSVLLLAGCSSSSSHNASGHTTGMPMTTATASYGPAATGPHNAADVTFATEMLPHHEQAVEMADMALSRDTNAQVKQLAQQIKGAQAPEIAELSGWLTGWNQPVPAAGSHPTNMSGMGAGNDGMMSDAEMTALDAASGTEFAKLWLTGMVKHHTGAVSMAKAALMGGQNSDTKALATSIVASQSIEIATMSKLLTTLV